MIQAILNYDEADAFELVRQIRSCDDLEEVADAVTAQEKGLLSAPQVTKEPAGDDNAGIDQFESELAGKMSELMLDGSRKFIGGTSNLIFLPSGSELQESISNPFGVDQVPVRLTVYLIYAEWVQIDYLQLEPEGRKMRFEVPPMNLREPSSINPLILPASSDSNWSIPALSSPAGSFVTWGADRSPFSWQSLRLLILPGHHRDRSRGTSSKASACSGLLDCLCFRVWGGVFRWQCVGIFFVYTLRR